MKKALMFALSVFLVACTSPQEVIIMPSMSGMMHGGGGLGGGMLPRIEYQCPLCGKQYKTEYLAEQCIDSHE